MRYIKTLELEGPAGSFSDWLLSPDDDLGCTMRVVRGGGADLAPTVVPHERVIVVFAGSVTLNAADGSSQASVGDTLFIPANAAGAVNAEQGSAWVEIVALERIDDETDQKAQVLTIDEDKYINPQDSGFYYQPLIDRTMGAKSMRLNTLKVGNNVGSPDWHIHAFAQMYLIQEGEMTVEIGRHRHIAGPNSLVVLPAGVVHRNFNVSGDFEKHVALLVPEPNKDEVFDFAVTIHEHEADMMKVLSSS